MMNNKELSARLVGDISLGGEISVHRLGFGAMRLTGEGIWGPPKDRLKALAVLRRAVELDINFIDTADSYGPNVSEELIAEALFPYPAVLRLRPREAGTVPARISGPTMHLPRIFAKLSREV
jgi:pyridoxine 4-dehydrogenase